MRMRVPPKRFRMNSGSVQTWKEQDSIHVLHLGANANGESRLTVSTHILSPPSLLPKWGRNLGPIRKTTSVLRPGKARKNPNSLFFFNLWRRRSFKIRGFSPQKESHCGMLSQVLHPFSNWRICVIENCNSFQFSFSEISGLIGRFGTTKIRTTCLGLYFCLVLFYFQTFSLCSAIFLAIWQTRSLSPASK